MGSYASLAYAQRWPLFATQLVLVADRHATDVSAALADDARLGGKRVAVERLSTADQEQGAFRSIVDAWFFSLEEDLLQENGGAPIEEAVLLERTNELMEKRLSSIRDVSSTFAATLRAYRAALASGDPG